MPKANARSTSHPLTFLFILICILSFCVTRSQAETTTSRFRISCTSSGQNCEPAHELAVFTNSQLQLQYSVLKETFYAHCSAVKLAISVDGTLVHTTGFLGWFEKGQPVDERPTDTGLLDLGSVTAGSHEITLKAQGLAEEGSCNSGDLIRWGGELKIVTDAPQGLFWMPVPTSGSGPVLGLLQKATLGDGELLAAVDEAKEKAGLGLTFVPGSLPQEVRWQQLPTTGAPLPTFKLPVDKGTVLAVRTTGQEKIGLDFAFVDGAVSTPVQWDFMNSNGSIPARTFQARMTVDGQPMTLMVLDWEGNGRRGLGLAVVPGEIPTTPSLSWSQVTFSGPPSTFFQAPVPGGVLLASFSDGNRRRAVGLTFVPGELIPSLGWRLEMATNSAFATYRARIEAGALFFSHFTGDQQSGEDLVFKAPGRDLE